MRGTAFSSPTVDLVVGGAVSSRLEVAADLDVLARVGPCRRRRSGRPGRAAPSRPGGSRGRPRRAWRGRPGAGSAGSGVSTISGGGRGRREVERDLDPARDGLPVAHRRSERPLARGDRRRLVEVRASRLAATSTFDTCPSASTVTARTTSACLRSGSADAGYSASTCWTTTGGVTFAVELAGACAPASPSRATTLDPAPKRQSSVVDARARKREGNAP